MSEEVWLNEEDVIALDQAVASTFQQDPKPSFLGLVDAYQAFVDSLDGYPFTIYDYDNDVTLRDNLDLALAALDPSLRDRALAILRRVDEAFDARTQTADRKFGSGSPRSCRLPIKSGPDLASDIESGNV